MKMSNLTILLQKKFPLTKTGMICSTPFSIDIIFTNSDEHEYLLFYYMSNEGRTYGQTSYRNFNQHYNRQRRNVSGISQILCESWLCTKCSCSRSRTNYDTDVVVSVLSLVLTALLLVKFNWAGSFSTTTEAGTTLNYFAIVSMVIGYVVIPILVYYYANANKMEKTNG